MDVVVVAVAVDERVSVWVEEEELFVTGSTACTAVGAVVSDSSLWRVTTSVSPSAIKRGDMRTIINPFL